MNPVRIRKYEGRSGSYLLVHVYGKRGDNTPRRMGATVGHYSRQRGRALAMFCKAVRDGEAEFVPDDDPDAEDGAGYWIARYDLKSSHMPMGMMETLRDNRR